MLSLVSSYGLDNSDAVINNVICNANYLTILQCSNNDNPPASCADEDPVSVICGKLKGEREAQS